MSRKEKIETIGKAIDDFAQVYYSHPDSVARLYSAMEEVEAFMIDRFARIREAERAEKRGVISG